MATITCPICRDATSLDPVCIESNRAFMPDRSSNRESIYEKAAVRAITDDDSPHYTSYGVFECQACSGRFLAKKHKWEDQEWVAVYPISHKPVSEEIPELVKSEFEEANLCFSIGAYRASVAMCATALEALWRERQRSGLSDLKDKGIISSNLYDRANEVRLWANVVKHELVPDVVEKEDAEQLLAYSEALLNAVYVEPKRFESLKLKRKQIEKNSN